MCFGKVRWCAGRAPPCLHTLVGAVLFMAVHGQNAAGLLTVPVPSGRSSVSASERGVPCSPRLPLGWAGERRAAWIWMPAGLAEVMAAGGWGRARWGLPTDVFPEWSSLFRVWGFNCRFLMGPHDVQDGYSLLGREGTVC